MDWIKGRITVTEVARGRKQFHFVYQKSSGKDGKIEFNPTSEEIKNIFLKAPELEAKWENVNKFTVKFNNKELNNAPQHPTAPPGAGMAAGAPKTVLPGENRLLPGKSAELLSFMEREDKLKKVNPNLIFNKFVWKYTGVALGKKEKWQFLKFVENTDISVPLGLYKKRMELAGARLRETFKDRVVSFAMSLNSRLITGLGSPSPAETGILLHHVYGVPYIPGSALKGVSRWAAIVNIAEMIEGEGDDGIYSKLAVIDKYIENFPSDKMEEFQKDIKDQIRIAGEVFGTKKSAGKIIFLDAYPDGKVRFKTDIMNPQYPEYYNTKGETPPGDWQKPIPIPFLTVEGGHFQFIMAQARESSDNHDLLGISQKWLSLALQNFGVGAKTAIGHGFFNLKNTAGA